MRDTGLFEREHAPDLSRKLSAGATKVNLAVSEGMSGFHTRGFACIRAAELPRAAQGHFGERPLGLRCRLRLVHRKKMSREPSHIDQHLFRRRVPTFNLPQKRGAT